MNINLAKKTLEETNYPLTVIGHASQPKHRAHPVNTHTNSRRITNNIAIRLVKGFFWICFIKKIGDMPLHPIFVQEMG